MLLVTTEHALWRYDNTFLFTNQSEVDFGIAHIHFFLADMFCLGGEWGCLRLVSSCIRVNTIISHWNKNIPGYTFSACIIEPVILPSTPINALDTFPYWVILK